MSPRSLLTTLLLTTTLLVPACTESDAADGRGRAAEVTTSRTARHAAACRFLTTADVETVVGKPATAALHANPDSCAVFSVDGKESFLVGRNDGAFNSFVAAVPADYYPIRTEVPGLGDVAIQFQGRPDSTAALLYVRKGDAAIVFSNWGLETSQLHALAKVAVSRL